MQRIETLILFLLFICASSIIAQPALVVDAGANITVCKGSTANLGGSPSATGGTTLYNYSWSPANMMIDPSVSNPVTKDLKASILFYLTVTDTQDTLTDSIFVYIDSLSSCHILTFYNTFTPNKDKINDTWTIVNADKYPDNRLEVYNRYGKLVFKAAPYNNDWAGTGLGEDLPAATYYYIFDPGGGVEIKREVLRSLGEV